MGGNAHKIGWLTESAGGMYTGFGIAIAMLASENPPLAARAVPALGALLSQL